MFKVSSELLENVVYNLCIKAAQNISEYPYNILKNRYEKSPESKILNIINNAETASKYNKPLCQDTGTVHIFFDIGNNITFSSNPYETINKAVSKCYRENFFRKSITENLLISAKNTGDNTPAIIETDYHEGNDLIIKVLLKGAGCDNVSITEMLLPNTTENDFINFVSEKILKKGKNACPPLFVSIACGGSSSNVLQCAEKNYFNNQKNELADKIKDKINASAEEKFNNFFVADLKLSLYPHHMASFPVGISINCHSLRISEAKINPDNSVEYLSNHIQNFEELNAPNTEIMKEINTSDIKALRALKEGDKILLSGEILIARDAAHRKMEEILLKDEKIPFDLKNKIIFYAAPCPPKQNEITGSIGPTTASRMDKYIPLFSQIIATIGKGERSSETKDFIRKNKMIYFEAEGGIAATLSSKFKSYEVVAFPELLSEAVAIAKIEKLPLTVSISKNN